MKIIILISISLFTVNACSQQQISTLVEPIPINSFQTKKISGDEAIKIAENFIIENGYTDLPAITEEKKVVFESIEWTSDVKEILKGRHNSLQKKAYGFRKGRKNSDKGFTVVFQYVSKTTRKTGRAVTMDLDGKNIRVEHVEIFLKAVEKL
jgi:hypothetical protein